MLQATDPANSMETSRRQASLSCAPLTAGRPCQRRHVRTLVLDLDDVLVHSDWSRARGWRTFKRPGAEDFLRTMSQFYEVVVYTSQLPTYADPILDRLDPQRYIAYRHVPPGGPFPCLDSMCTWAPVCPGPAWQKLQRGPSSDTFLCRLYRNSTQYKDGKHVRDLSKLNRDLSNVLLITSDPDAFFLQPDNAIKVGTSVAALLLLVSDQPLPHTMQSCTRRCTLCPVV